MSAALRAVTVARQGAWSRAFDRVSLDYDERFLRRKRLVTDAGLSLHVDLPEMVSLDAGDALVLADGRAVEVVGAPEALYQLESPTLVRLAWHIGNRHTPCAIGDGYLRIRRDHVLAEMARHLGATVTEVVAPFAPEGGAYGHGRALGHTHDHEEDAHG